MSHNGRFAENRPLRRRLSIGAIAAVTASLAGAAEVSAEGSSIGYGMGGPFARYDPIVAQYNRTGELFRIRIHCQSACTLFLGIRNVCIERSARLLFHAGHDKNNKILDWAVEHMRQAYNPKLRSYLDAGGHLKTLAFHTISGRDMIEKFGYRECPKR